MVSIRSSPLLRRGWPEVRLSCRIPSEITETMQGIIGLRREKKTRRPPGSARRNRHLHDCTAIIGALKEGISVVLSVAIIFAMHLPRRCRCDDWELLDLRPPGHTLSYYHPNLPCESERGNHGRVLGLAAALFLPRRAWMLLHYPIQNSILGHISPLDLHILDSALPFCDRLAQPFYPPLRSSRHVRHGRRRS